VRLEGCDVDGGGYSILRFRAASIKQLTHPYALPYEKTIRRGDRRRCARARSMIRVLEGALSNHRQGALHHDDAATGIRIRNGSTPLQHPHPPVATRCLRSLHVHASRLFAGRYGYHQMIPSLSSAKGGISTCYSQTSWSKRLFGLNSILERIPLVNRISTNIFMVGRKVQSFL